MCLQYEYLKEIVKDWNQPVSVQGSKKHQHLLSSLINMLCLVCLICTQTEKWFWGKLHAGTISESLLK